MAQLENQLAAVAALKPSLDGLSRLQQPLEQVGSLIAPLGAVTSLLERPLLLVLAALIGLLAWGAVTFVAVKLAIVSAARTTGRAG